MIRWLPQFVLMLAVALFTPFVMLVAVWFQSRATGRMPWCFRFLETYDDLGPEQGMYEPTVQDIFERFGWRAKQWYWLGIRNQCYTLFWWLAPALVDDAALTREGVHGGEFWYYAIRLPANGPTYWERGMSGTWPNGKKWTLACGWKLFSIERFFSTASAPKPPLFSQLDRPLFYLQIKPYSTV